MDKLAEEIVALCAIFEEDCEILPGSPPQIVIKLRPYAKDMGSDDADVSAVLHVRCLPGYPTNCPKLQIIPEKGLSESDAEKLLSLLHDQASLNAEEGRVMIFNLVEAAKEFMSGIEPVGKSNDSKLLRSTMESNQELLLKDKANSDTSPSFVYGFIDLFSGYEGSNKSTPLSDSSGSHAEELIENGNESEKELLQDLILTEPTSEDDEGINASATPESESSSEDNEGINASATLESESSSEYNEGINASATSETESSASVADHQMDLEGLVPISPRYLNDFVKIRHLGDGAFGRVMLCKNKIDGREYAVKIIRLEDKSMPVIDRILREVATLSRLQHQHVVRYYQAWFEDGVIDSDGTSGSAPTSFSSPDVHENDPESTCLYIQMEYCPKTLREVFESNTLDDDKDNNKRWSLFREIVEGLAHIHEQAIIHRDLTRNNIFIDAQNHIKIGDFGLAKFLKLEQLDQDPKLPANTTGVSISGSQVGTPLYRAPEIVQRRPKIDEKVDIYSLGVIFFEFWNKFGTESERTNVISKLREKGDVPPTWVVDFPKQAAILPKLMSRSPSDRISATELLQDVLPPRMESESLDDILRTMQTSEDTSMYDKVVNAIFDKEMSIAKEQHHRAGRFGSVGDNCCSIQYTDLESKVRDYVVDATKEVFSKHCAKHLEILPMRLLDDFPQYNRNAVKLLTQGGDMLELCHELRLPFVNWIISNQISSFRRYEISCVYRRALGHSLPNRYLQGDFDIIGGRSALREVEVIKVTRDIVTSIFPAESCDIHLNHGDLMDAIWSWIGVKVEHRPKVAELLSMMGSLRPQSSARKSKWEVIRRQLLQELDLAEAVVNRLETVGVGFCGDADHALPRLRRALPWNRRTWKALDELSELFSFLGRWGIDSNVYIDALMPPTESYHRDLFFQVYLTKENNPGSLPEGALLAIGGRYDYLLHQMWSPDYKGSPPCGVGTSLALETIIQNFPVDL